MELREAITTRRMVRRTDDEPLDTDRVLSLLDLARRAPSAGNAQGVDWVLVATPEGVDRLATLAGEAEYVARGFDPWLSTSPVIVVPCADVRRYRARYAEPDKDGGGPATWDVPYWWMDLGAAVQNLLLLATEAGLAAGFLGAHAVPGLAEALELPMDVHPAGLLTLGHPHPDGDRDTVSAARPRRNLDEVIHDGTW